MKILLKLAALAAGVGSVAASAASAGVVYQSIPDLTANPTQNAWCSQCASNGQNIGQLFTLGSGAVANTLSFDVQGNYAWPSPVTIDFFQDAGGALGANIYHQTFRRSPVTFPPATAPTWSPST